MLSRLKKDKKGFTLIEIVLVLAIAGLIMVIVFLAVAGAQRARRDTARKSDATRLAALVVQLASNNNGGLPSAVTLKTAFDTPTVQLDPDGTAYLALVTTAPPGAGAAPHQMYYVQQAFCPTVSGATAGVRDYAIYVYQEGSPTSPFCVDSH